MKIAYICNFIGPNFQKAYCNNKSYSVSASLKSTAIIRAFLLAGHSVTVFSPGITVCSRYIKNHIEVLSFPEGKVSVLYSNIFSFRKFSFINSFFLYNSVNKIHKKVNFDMLLFYNITFDAALVSNSFNNKVKVLEYEDNIFNKALIGCKNNFEFLKMMLFKYVINRTDAAIIVGKAMLKEIPLKAKVHIPGALSEDVINNITFNRKTWDGMVPLKIALAGGVHYSKGADLIIKALDFIEHPCEMRFYGNGTFDSYTSSLMHEAPKRHIIKNMGFIKHSELIKILGNDSHILINSTRNMGVEPNSEGYPFKMLEYAATGRPIVSSTIGRLDDEFNKCISFYDIEDPKVIADAINRIASNYEEYSLKAITLQQRVVNEFSIEGISRRINDFVKELEKND